MFFKVVHNKEVHVYNPKDQASYFALQKYIRDVFKQLPAKYQLTYFDEQDEEITLAGQTDFQTMQQVSKKTVKIFIKEVDESFYDETQKVVLDDELNVEPIEEKMQELKLQEPQKPETVEVPTQPIEKPEQVEKVEESLEKPNFEDENQPLIEEEKIDHEIEEKNFENMESIPSSLNQSQISNITEADIEQKFKEMMPEFMEKIKSQLLNKSEIKSEEAPKRQQKIVHQHITCDQCGDNNIEGVRYKCAVCADFDLCERCEVKSTHDHPFLKIKHPRQAPYKILAIVNDEEQNSFEVNGQRVRIPQIPFVNQLFEAFCGPRQPPQEGFCGPNFRGRCPYKNPFAKKEENKEQKKEEKKEEKVEIKSEPQKKVKVEEKPVPAQNQEKPKEVANKRIEEQRKPSLQELSVENASYLEGILEIDFNRCYKFASKNPNLSKEGLLELYFSNPNAI